MEARGMTAVSPALAVRVRDLHVRRGDHLVLAGVSFDVHRGDVVALMGASGSGKTTILRVMAGLEPFDAGEIDVEGIAVAPQGSPPDRLRALRQRVGMVFQFHGLFEHLSVLQNVTLALVHVLRVPRGEADHRARHLLAALGVEHRARAVPRELSGGEAQRVAIARALAIDPPLLLMDEPTASLDPVRRAELADLVRTLAGRHRTLLIVTHDREFATLATTRQLVLEQGRVTSLYC